MRSCNRTRLRIAPAIALGLLAIVVVRTPHAAAGGTIDTAGASIAAGAAPTPGTVTIDAAAPVGTVPTLPTIDGPGDPPTITSSMPTQPSYGDGNEGAFTAGSGSVPLSPGTHQFSSFTVSNGASVTLSGATTILVQDAVSIAGSVTSDVSGGSITIHCGGDFTLVSRNPASLVQTSQVSSPIEIVAGGLIAIGSDAINLDARVNAAASDLRIDAYGVSPTVPAIGLRSGRALAPMGGITLQCDGWFSSGGITSTRPGIVDCQGPLTIRSYGGNLTANSNGDFNVTNGDVTFECAAWLYLGGDLIVGGTGDVNLKTVAGPFGYNGMITTVEGDFTLLCGGNADIYGSTTGPSGGGNVSVRVAGYAHLRSNQDFASGEGDVEIIAAGDVVFDSFAQARSSGTLRVTSSTGDVRLRASSALRGQGTTIVRAAGEVFIGEETPPEKTSLGTDVTLDTASFDLAAGGPVTIDAVSAQAVSGPFRVLAGGEIGVARTIGATGDVSLRTIGGDIDVAGATVTTADMASDGAVSVETWKAGGQIDAADATLRSGTSAGASGDVDVLVHDPGATPDPVVASYILPKKLKASIDPDHPSRTKIVAAGFFDVGPTGVVFTDPAKISVGNLTFDIAGFVADRKGRKFTYKDDTLAVTIVPHRKGSSRAKFRLLAKGEPLAGVVQRDAPVSLGFQSGSVSGGGTVLLTHATYKFGKRRGALVEPNLYPARTKAKLAGAEKDALMLVLGLATDGVTPESAPDVHLEFGADFALDVASGAFVRRGDRYSAPGVALDYRRETLTVKVKKTSLGDGFAEGAQPVTVKVQLGDVSREVRVRMVRKGKKLYY